MTSRNDQGFGRRIAPQRVEGRGRAGRRGGRLDRDHRLSRRLGGEEKVLRYLGTAVNQSDDITKKVKEDTGITIQNIVATTDDVTKRVITQPNSFDILDTEYFSLKKLVPSGNILRAWTPRRSRNSTTSRRSSPRASCRTAR